MYYVHSYSQEKMASQMELQSEFSNHRIDNQSLSISVVSFRDVMACDNFLDNIRSLKMLPNLSSNILKWAQVRPMIPIDTICNMNAVLNMQQNTRYID